MCNKERRYFNVVERRCKANSQRTTRKYSLEADLRSTELSSRHCPSLYANISE
jgi:hypothetical protein